MTSFCTNGCMSAALHNTQLSVINVSGTEQQEKLQRIYTVSKGELVVLLISYSMFFLLLADKPQKKH